MHICCQNSHLKTGKTVVFLIKKLNRKTARRANTSLLLIGLYYFMLFYKINFDWPKELREMKFVSRSIRFVGYSPSFNTF